MKRDRIPEIHFYEWRISSWAISETRDRLDAAGRGIYRELLDACYGQGVFPDDRGWMIRRCACTEDEFEKTWPLIQKHFPISKTPGYRNNIPANIVRREYFAYIEGQRKKRKNAIHKAKGNNAIQELAPTENNFGQFANQPNGNTTATAIQYNGNTNGKESVCVPPTPPALALVPPSRVDCELRFKALYDAHIIPGFIQDGRYEYVEIIGSAINPEKQADLIDAAHAEWMKFFHENPSEYRPGIGKWLSESYFTRKPRARDSPSPKGMAEQVKQTARQRLERDGRI